MKWLVIFKGSNGQYAILVDDELSENDAVEQARSHVFVVDDDELVRADFGNLGRPVVMR